MDYIAQWNYVSSYGGPWKKGDLVELKPEDAALINNDSPGVLVLAEEAEPEAEAEPEEGERKQTSKSNRRKTASSNRSA